MYSYHPSGNAIVVSIEEAIKEDWFAEAMGMVDLRLIVILGMLIFFLIVKWFFFFFLSFFISIILFISRSF
jgi:maltodextrin utilization protein YvdJ